MITGRWIFKRLIGWEWAIWHDGEEFASEHGWCWTRAGARRKAGLEQPPPQGERSE